MDALPGLPFGPHDSARLWAGTGTLDVLAPDPDRFDLGCICRALARIPRYSGMTDTFISVAHHLLLCDWMVPWAAGCLPQWHPPRNGLPPEIDQEFLRRGVLIHDFPEAYIQDLPNPLKSLPALRAYREAESRIMAAMNQRWMAAENPRQRKALFHMKTVRKRLDAAAVIVEADAVMPPEARAHFRVEDSSMPPDSQASVRLILGDPAPARTLENRARDLGVR